MRVRTTKSEHHSDVQ